MLQPIRNIDEYKRVKDELKKGSKLNDLKNNLYSESSLKCYSL